jgi:hypothetical protein
MSKTNYEGCDNCKHHFKLENEFPCVKCKHNYADMYEPATNADILREMTDEERLRFVRSCVAVIIEWLNSKTE